MHGGGQTMTEAGGIYHAIKLAAQLFGRPLESLTAAERRRVSHVAARLQEIETLILGTPEAASVLLPAASIDASLLAIRRRYADDDEFQAELGRLGLDVPSLRQAVACDLVVEAVLEEVAARSEPISDTDVEIYWHLNQHRFRQGETRLLRHLLVTINEDLAGSGRHDARARIDAIRTRLVSEPQRFAEQALKHSECPSAVRGGLLGSVPRGQLYPELDAVAFALAEGGLSEVIESELGYHLVRCDAIHKERRLTFADARQTIREHLESRQKACCQKAWIKALRRQAGAGSPVAHQR